MCRCIHCITKKRGMKAIRTGFLSHKHGVFVTLRTLFAGFLSHKARGFCHTIKKSLLIIRAHAENILSNIYRKYNISLGKYAREGYVTNMK